MFKNIALKLLHYLARQVIAKRKPKIIGITGSVGKTSTKEAIFSVLAETHKAYRASKNFNNDWGLALAILQLDAHPGKNPFTWLKLYLKVEMWCFFFKDYPEILVLEYGIDHPGDMDKLLALALPDISVITDISLAHYEFFESVEIITQEKLKLASALAENKRVILNSDSPILLAHKDSFAAHTLMFGVDKQADIKLDAVGENLRLPCSTELYITHEKRSHQVKLQAIGVGHVTAALAAVATGVSMGLSFDEIRAGLATYTPAPGRSNLLAGIKGGTVLDDTYNASPLSMQETIKMGMRMPYSKKLFVLGDMLELGSISDAEHTKLGEKVADANPDIVFWVGKHTKLSMEAATLKGMPLGKQKYFSSSEEAKIDLAKHIAADSLIVVKGSQGIRMEKVVEEIMADPALASKLLCRQYGKWL